MVEMLARSAQVLIALGGAYVVAFWFVLIVWTFRDIEARSRSVVTQVVSTLLVVLFFVPGILLYMILRPKETLDEAFQRSLEEEYLLQDLEELPLCPACHRYVEDDFVLCPHCHAQLREPCVACARLVDLKWPLCPYCASVQHGRAVEAERVEVPAARWTAPGLRRRRAVEESVVRDPTPAVAANGHGTPVEQETVAAAVAERGAPAEAPSVPFTLVSGMRSIVRPLDRIRGRNGTGAEDEEGREGGSVARSRLTNGASGRFDRTETETAPRDGSDVEPWSNGGHERRSAFVNGLFTVNGAGHRDDGEEGPLGVEAAAAAAARSNGASSAASESEVAELPGHRR